MRKRLWEVSPPTLMVGSRLSEQPSGLEGVQSDPKECPFTSVSLQSCAQAPVLSLESPSDTCPLSIVPGPSVTHRDVHLSLAWLLIMVTWVGSLCPTHTCHGSFYLAWLSPFWRNRSLRPKTYFSFLFSPKYLLHLFLPLIPSSNLLSVILNTVPLVNKSIRTMMMTVMGSSLFQI